MTISTPDHGEQHAGAALEPRARRAPAAAARSSSMSVNSAASRNGSAEAQRIDRQQRGARGRGRPVLALMRQDRAEDRADAGRPAEGEGKAEQEGADDRGRPDVDMEARLALQQWIGRSRACAARTAAR